MATILRKPDAQLARDVRQELQCDARLQGKPIQVDVDAGVVTLTGHVDSWGTRLAAQDAAHRVIGVLDVANDIAVAPPASEERTDTTLAMAVRSALEWDVLVPDQLIRSTVSQGVVTLEGEVYSATQRDDCERAIRNLAGVRRVINQIAVRPPVMIYDLRRAIEEALERRAAREARRISFEVHGGLVTVSGIVHSWAEREAVVGAVKGTPGVTAVQDRLQTEPYL
jgi:osmotically-inducible protein OsmY